MLIIRFQGECFIEGLSQWCQNKWFCMRYWWWASVGFLKTRALVPSSIQNSDAQEYDALAKAGKNDRELKMNIETLTVGVKFSKGLGYLETRWNKYE